MQRIEWKAGRMPAFLRRPSSWLPPSVPRDAGACKLIGRVCDRANVMQALVRSGGVVTDAETFAALAVHDRAGFAERDGYAYLEP